MHELKQTAHKNMNFLKSGSSSELRPSMFFNNLKQNYLKMHELEQITHRNKKIIGFYGKVRANPHRHDLFDRLRLQTVFIAVKQGKGVPEN